MSQGDTLFLAKREYYFLYKIYVVQVQRQCLSTSPETTAKNNSRGDTPSTLRWKRPITTQPLCARRFVGYLRARWIPCVSRATYGVRLKIRKNGRERERERTEREHTRGTARDEMDRGYNAREWRHIVYEAYDRERTLVRRRLVRACFVLCGMCSRLLITQHVAPKRNVVFCRIAETRPRMNIY